MKQTQNYRSKMITICHLQFDAVETGQSHPLELIDIESEIRLFADDCVCFREG